VRQRHPDPQGVGGGRVDHDDLHLLAEGGVLLGEPALHAASGAAGGQAEQQPPTGRVGVDEAGQPRVRPSPPRGQPQPPDAAGPGFVDAKNRRRRRGGQPLRGGGDQRPVSGVPGDAVLGSDLRHRPVRPPIAAARCSRSLVVSRDRGGIATVRSRNERRGHEEGRHSRRRLRHHSSTR